MRRTIAVEIGVSAMKVTRLFTMKNPVAWRRDEQEFTPAGTEPSIPVTA